LLKVIKGVYIKDVLCEKPDISVYQRFIKKAKNMEEEVSVITTHCGYFSYFQDEIAQALNIYDEILERTGNMRTKKGEKL
jgi:hypothetical protein